MDLPQPLPQPQPLLQVVLLQISIKMVIVMIPTIPLDAIMTVVIAVHLMQLWIMVVGMSIVQVVNVLSLQQQQLLQQLLLHSVPQIS